MGGGGKGGSARTLLSKTDAVEGRVTALCSAPSTDPPRPPPSHLLHCSVGDQRDTDTGGLSSVQIASRGKGPLHAALEYVAGEITRETDRPSTLEAVNCRTG